MKKIAGIILIGLICAWIITHGMKAGMHHGSCDKCAGHSYYSKR